MPGTKLTEDVVKDVTEGLLEELKEMYRDNQAHFEFFFEELQEASGRLWSKYRGKPYQKIRLCRYPGDKMPPLVEVPRAGR